MWRNSSDYYNNFFIDIVSQSYLDEATKLGNDQSNIN
jgi:hypothetical protein